MLLLRVVKEQARLATSLLAWIAPELLACLMSPSHMVLASVALDTAEREDGSLRLVQVV